MATMNNKIQAITVKDLKNTIKSYRGFLHGGENESLTVSVWSDGATTYNYGNEWTEREWARSGEPAAAKVASCWLVGSNYIVNYADDAPWLNPLPLHKATRSDILGEDNAPNEEAKRTEDVLDENENDDEEEYDDTDDLER
jgi:hypothetical protein